ncbi:ATP-binding protein [Nocardioides sp.]|uniref:ATP-binding protein n=1 Tax=Nocardioides sp. TaxID=35761 RepID=UPI002B273260|nr:ATP-binding protein [Nocardioides sp.]
MHVRAGAEVDTVVAQVLDALVRVSGARRAGLALSEGAGRRLRFTSSDRDLEVTPDGEVGLRWDHIDAYDHQPLTSVVRTGKPVMGVLALMAAQYPDFAESLRGEEIVAVAAVPLRSRTDILGGIVLLYDVPQPFGAQQIAQLEFTATRAATELREAGRPLSPMVPLRPDGPGGSDDSEAEKPGEPDHEVADLEMDATPVAVARVRRFARQQLQQWGVEEDVLDAVVLCVSELVTNVVMHAGSKAWIRLTRDDDRVGVTVRDGGGPALFAVSSSKSAEALQVHGRGLQLVESLSDEWGSEIAHGGTTVWCVFWRAAATA